MKLNNWISFAVLALASAGAFAQDAYPNKAINWVVPNPAGGGADTAVRIIANALSTSIGQPIVIINRPGGATVIGAAAVAKAKPDGYTILTGDVATFAINPNLLQNLPYDTEKDFDYVALTTSYPLLLVAKASLPVKTPLELIEYAKKNPKKLNFGSAGFGVAHHFALELLMEKTGAQFVHVPYKGSVDALRELLGEGQVDAMFLDVASGRAFLAEKGLKVLGVATKKRFDQLPNIPTLAEQGLDFDFNLWQGVVAPKGTPPQAIAILNRELNKVLQSPDVRARLLAMGAIPQNGTPQEFHTLARTENVVIGKLAREKNISIK